MKGRKNTTNRKKPMYEERHAQVQYRNGGIKPSISTWTGRHVHVTK